MLSPIHAPDCGQSERSSRGQIEVIMEGLGDDLPGMTLSDLCTKRCPSPQPCEYFEGHIATAFVSV